MPKIIFGEQHEPDGTPHADWLQLRCGRITGSRMCDVMAYSVQKARLGQELKVRADYRMELVSERLTGRTPNHFVTNEMKWGAQQEQFGRSVYEQTQDALVQPVCFAVHPAMDFSGASPDGLVDDDRGIEIKCLITANHLEIWESMQVPQAYYDQIQWNMACCERFKWDFVCYDSRLPEHLQLIVIPVEYDEKRIAELTAEVVKMHTETEAMIERFSSGKRTIKEQLCQSLAV